MPRRYLKQNSKKRSDSAFHRVTQKIEALLHSGGQSLDLSFIDLMEALSVSELDQMLLSLRKATQLLEIDLSNNSLVVLPDSIGQLTQLQALYLGNNQLKNLPDSIGQLTRLRVLHVGNNQLRNIPESIGRLAELKILQLGDNPLAPDLQRHYNNGDLLTHLKELAQSKSEPLPFNEAKLLLVGAGEVGKTWLLCALQGKVPEAYPATKGLEIAREPLDIPHPENDGRILHLNCWDFGGQENFQITHQIFFSPKAIYLLVWKPRRDPGLDVVTRLERIRLSAGHSAKVFIVSTHAADDVPAVIGEKALKERFGDIIQGFYAVDSAKGPNGIGISELKAAIAKAVVQIEDIDLRFLPEWHRARKAVKITGKFTLSLREFKNICVSQGVEYDRCEALASQMDMMGNVVFFREAPQSEEANIGVEDNLVVLDPEWLAKAVASVIEDKLTAGESGVLSHSRLHEIWKEDTSRGYPGYDKALFGYLLWMMWKFDIAYKQDISTSLVPELIESDQPSYLLWTPSEESAGTNRVRLICRINHDAPSGLVPVLTAALHPWRRVKNPIGIVDKLDRNWSKGFFIETERVGTAFVELSDRDLYIEVRGANPRFLCEEVRKTLEEIKNKRWPGMDMVYRVPCFGSLTNGDACTGTFNWESLKDWRNKGIRGVLCEKCREEVSISDMLVGLDFQQAKIQRQLRDIRIGQEDLLGTSLSYFRHMIDPNRTEILRGPCMLSITPDEPNGWNLVGRATEKRVRVMCWCEHPDGPHPLVPFGSKKPPEYVLKAPQEWLIKVAPYISWSALLMKAFVPMVGTVTKTAMEQVFQGDLDFQKELKAQIDIMNDASKALPTGKLEVGQRVKLDAINDHNDSPKGISPEIIALGHVHEALIEQVPRHKRWGGLRPIATSSGSILWLCPQHADQQNPPVLNI